MWKSRSSEALATILIVLLVIIVVAIMWNFASALMCQTKEKMNELADVQLSSEPVTNEPMTNNKTPGDAPDPTKPKFVVYHWGKCGHCQHIMGDDNGPSIFSQLQNTFNNDVSCLNFEFPKHEEANAYNAFPVIKFIAVKNGQTYINEYNEEGERTFAKLKAFIEKNLQAIR